MQSTAGVAFRKVERSYESTPNGWRLATYEEAKKGLQTIKNKNLLKRWDRVRLLDGWITGPGYNFEMGDDFKGCLGYMLLIQTQASGMLSYSNIKFVWKHAFGLWKTLLIIAYQAISKIVEHGHHSDIGCQIKDFSLN
ncbi:uncharacterized protein LOC131053479 isoform X2 [Cryptomeria japonica]|uniref:uncharacterized protein LOC131053479 isoform X2 n=1 Tax=Cryptomeria japonica TaxID=3369 RepID=UPI0025AB8EF4|nr:uncharacterized protein LOC131053479 isoform X2 [Cryptomeria japonica]